MTPPTVTVAPSAGWVRRIAWALWLASLALLALGVLFLGLSASTPIPPTFGFRGVNAIFAVTFSTVGAVITLRRPRSPIGWLFATAGLGFAVGAFTSDYAVYAVLTSPGWPLGAEAAWVTQWGFPLVLGAVAAVFLLFPDGRLLSARWRPMLWLAGLGPAAAAVAFAVSPGPLDEFNVVSNPFGLEAAGAVAEVVGSVGMSGLALALFGAGVSLVLRFRCARGEQRQQLKWMAYAAALAGIALVASITSSLVVGVGSAPMVFQVLIICALTAIPVAAALAILRYRLYDIDRLVNRTLVYGLLTALLGSTYAAVVLVLGQLLGRRSSLTVAVATLAVWALFWPARRRIQEAVDRRFNRRHYDAAKTIEAFSTRLREQVDLDTLSAELLTVVDQTVQPTTASLWLRPSARPLASSPAQTAKPPDLI